MDKISIWKNVNRYFSEGIIIPIQGDYIVDNKDGTFNADLIGSLILAHVGPTKFGVKGEMPAIEPGVASGLIKIYSPREIALLECAYEGTIYKWSEPYLSKSDNELLADWDVGNKIPYSAKHDVKQKYRYYIRGILRTCGDIEEFLKV
jgi:hypothetical protein